MAETLRGNRYPGRGIVIGKSADGKRAVFAYFIMGRSANSRNRIFEEQGEELLIRPFDVSQVKDPSLILYTPVRDWANG
jgi:IMP cyclohydrolase